jgi:hypothetical protein
MGPYFGTFAHFLQFYLQNSFQRKTIISNMSNSEHDRRGILEFMREDLARREEAVRQREQAVRQRREELERQKEEQRRQWREKTAQYRERRRNRDQQDGQH